MAEIGAALPAAGPPDPEHLADIYRRHDGACDHATMVIVAGHLIVAAEARESYLAGCVGVVEQAREAPGCLDFSITADLVDPARIDIFERWESQADVEAFRGSGPSGDQAAAILGASVCEFDIADVRSLTS